MRVYTTVEQIQTYLAQQRKNQQTVALIPTLGALHHGHLQLMKHAISKADIVVVSIFVNPTQFNDPKDLEKYPRPLAQDIHLLCAIPVDLLFLPTVEEMYPENLRVEVPIDITHLTNVMEGPKRPGHFEGVITIVKRLLDIVLPDFLIMGQKDYQQQTIIRSMIDQLEIPTHLLLHPTVRDYDGLALSSRNARISPELRPIANGLYLSLKKAAALVPNNTPGMVERLCGEMLSSQGFGLEYFAIVDGETLQEVRNWEDSDQIVACVAAWLGEVRLIDNIRLK